MGSKLRNYKKKATNAYYKFKGYYPTNLNGLDLKLNHENLKFWRDCSSGTWEPETFLVLDKFLKPDMLYLDIGAWIGPTVIYASTKCKKVICFEPDPVAYHMLQFNLKKNNINNVSSYNFAISDKSGIQTMNSFGENIGDSMSSLLSNQNQKTVSFEVLVLDWDFVESKFGLENIGMIKVDIEGGEFDLLKKLKGFLEKNKPILWLSLHVPFLEESKRLESLNTLVDTLQGCYKYCFNEKLEEIDFNELKSEECLNGFPAFLFKN